MRKNKVTVITYFPGQRIERTTHETHEADAGVAIDYEGSGSLMLSAPVAVWQRKSRIGLPKRPEAIFGRFPGDGEAINFAAGPLADWREVEDSEARVEDDDFSPDIEGARKSVEEERNALNEKASAQALMAAVDTRNPQKGQFLGIQALMWVVVMAVLLLVFLNTDTSAEWGFSLKATAEERPIEEPIL